MNKIRKYIVPTLSLSKYLMKKKTLLFIYHVTLTQNKLPQIKGSTYWIEEKIHKIKLQIDYKQQISFFKEIKANKTFHVIGLILQIRLLTESKPLM